jgi:hypothetical protein
MVNFHAQVHYHCQLFYMATVVMGTGHDGGQVIMILVVVEMVVVMMVMVVVMMVVGVFN